MRKIAVIFPGVGYTKDRPLLYYSGKLAKQHGYEIRFVDFSGIEWSKEKLKDRAALLKILEWCLERTEKALLDISETDDTELVFISKSIGTVVSTAYAKKKSLKPRQICFSPLEYIGEFVDGEDAELFCGDADPYAQFASLEAIAKDKKLKMHRISGGNHSLETGDIDQDLANIREMMKCVSETL